MADLGIPDVIKYLDENLGILWDVAESYVLTVKHAGQFASTHLTYQNIAYALLTLLLAAIIASLCSKPFADLRFKYSLRYCWRDLAAMMERNHSQPLFLRLAFADASTFDQACRDWPFCGGANGSIRFDSELSEPFNAGLSRAIEMLRQYKRKYNLISWADLIQMAGAVAVFTTGGPRIDLLYGREDIPVDLRELSEDQQKYYRRLYCRSMAYTSSNDQHAMDLPKVFPPYPRGEPTADAHLRRIFYRMGVSNSEIVALMGAHTIGRGFQDRSGVCPFSSGDQGATTYTKLTAAAHGSRIPTHPGIGMAGGCSWTSNWLQFDNSYFRRPFEDPTNKELLWLPTDQALIDCPEFQRHFVRFAQDQEVFFAEYAAAHKKMSELGAKFRSHSYVAWG